MKLGVKNESALDKSLKTKEIITLWKYVYILF